MDDHPNGYPDLTPVERACLLNALGVAISIALAAATILRLLLR